MTEGLSKKKRVRGGHRSSASRIMNEADEAIKASCETGVIYSLILSKLTQCKKSLQDKLDKLNRLEEILNLATS